MKKFLSLVLAMIMTMSLVTIGAGAIEYDDLTDKDEITYEEAVAVLTKIGIFDGYEDNSFKPAGELTRGAAAKIIVGLLIGPEAAQNLTVAAAPYPDVPVTNTFAAVISYCKTANIISGYSDGTFKPTGTLTGYAFSKMLLGAIGYRSDVEGFTGTGWTMNVAKIGNAAGLFNRIEFAGGEAVNRETACQLALNTLKATMVEYSGGFSISTGDATVVGAQTRSYVTSNQPYAANINNKKAGPNGGVQAGSATASSQHYTVEFGEEHFKDLRLNADGSAFDDFGRPANNWSWKKVTIGTFMLQPDFRYEKLMEHKDKSAAAKNRATGLSGYKTYTLDADGKDCYTRVWMNGVLMNGAIDFSDGLTVSSTTGAFTNGTTSGTPTGLFSITDINDLTDNGTLVDVYVSGDYADFITDVVVVKSQLMQIKKVGSDYVSLELYDDKQSDDWGSTYSTPGARWNFLGFNSRAINENVINVQPEDDAYAVVSALKEGDQVVVIPVADDYDFNNVNTTDWLVAEAYEPEKVTGTLTAVIDYGTGTAATGGTRNAIELNVGGTVYPVSLWSKSIYDIDGDIIKVTKKDVTLTLDKYGNAMLAKDVGATNDFMVVGTFYSTLENGRIVTLVSGWDISGNEIELNLGPKPNLTGIKSGDLVRYTSDTNSNLAEWKIYEDAAHGVYNVWNGEDSATGDAYKIKASNVNLLVREYSNSTDYSPIVWDKSVKFIYVTFDNDGEVEAIEIKNGVQDVSNDELLRTYNGKVDYYATGRSIAKAKDGYNTAQAAVKAVNGTDAVKAVVIKQESNDAISTSMLYVSRMVSGAEFDVNGKVVYQYTVAMNTEDGLDNDVTIYSYKRLSQGDFASYAEVENPDYSKTPFYDLRQHNNFVGRTTSTFQGEITGIKTENGGLVSMDPTLYRTVTGNLPLDAEPELKQNQGDKLGLGNVANVINILKANFVDLRTVKTGGEIDSYTDLKTVMCGNLDYVQRSVTVKLVINDNPDSNGFRTAAMVVVLGDTDNVDTDTRDLANLLTVNIMGARYNEGGTNGYTAMSNSPAALASKDSAKSSPRTAAAAVSLNETALKKDRGVIDFSFEGKSSDLLISYETTGTYIQRTWNTLTKGGHPAQDLKKGNQILIGVQSYGGQWRYSLFEIGTPTAVTYANEFVTQNADRFAAVQTNSTDAKYSNGSLVTLDGTGAFHFPFLDTGIQTETQIQLDDAIEYYNDANPYALVKLGEAKYAVGTRWDIYAEGTDNIVAHFDEATTTNRDVLVHTKANPATVNWTLKAVASGKYVSTDASHVFASVTAVASVQEINRSGVIQTEKPVVTPTTTVAKPGAYYTDAVYTEFDTTARTVVAPGSSDGYSFKIEDGVTYTLVGSNAAVQAGDVVTSVEAANSIFAKENAVLQVTLICTGNSSNTASKVLRPVQGSSTLVVGDDTPIPTDIAVNAPLVVSWKAPAATTAKISAAPTISIA